MNQNKFEFVYQNSDSVYTKMFVSEIFRIIRDTPRLQKPDTINFFKILEQYLQNSDWSEDGAYYKNKHFKITFEIYKKFLNPNFKDENFSAEHCQNIFERNKKILKKDDFSPEEALFMLKGSWYHLWNQSEAYDDLYFLVKYTIKNHPLDFFEINKFIDFFKNLL